MGSGALAEVVGARIQELARSPAPLRPQHRQQAGAEFSRIRADTLTGMAFSNVIALSIILTTAAALHSGGVISIESSAQAAEALRPLAGDFAFGPFRSRNHWHRASRRSGPRGFGGLRDR
jgi:Mn2+/Fe2+ NRAMP family transporter